MRLTAAFPQKKGSRIVRGLLCRTSGKNLGTQGKQGESRRETDRPACSKTSGPGELGFRRITRLIGILMMYAARTRAYVSCRNASTTRSDASRPCAPNLRPAIRIRVCVVVVLTDTRFYVPFPRMAAAVLRKAPCSSWIRRQRGPVARFPGIALPAPSSKR